MPVTTVYRTAYEQERAARLRQEKRERVSRLLVVGLLPLVGVLIFLWKTGGL